LSTVTIKKGSKNLTSYFTITKANGTLTVNKRPITVKCKDQSQTDGNVSCSAGTSWGIKFWNDLRNEMSSLCPYQGGCGSKPKCAVKCF
jgi:hypothetical protein